VNLIQIIVRALILPFRRELSIGPEEFVANVVDVHAQFRKWIDEDGMNEPNQSVFAEKATTVPSRFFDPFAAFGCRISPSCS
jgi:hypothetical protein